jgi:hypothetical protein
VAEFEPTDVVLGRLDGVVRQAEGWRARCPAHADDHPSLSISRGADGQALLHCHAGCGTEAIVVALGLAMADLFPPKERAADRAPHVTATYDYRDEGGCLLYQVCRSVPKAFRVRRPAGDGRWIWDLKDVRRVPYRLPGLLATDPAEPVLVVEGEKDADRLTALGFVATTNLGGASKWRREYGDVLRGRRVVVLPDNDAPGHSHAASVVSSLRGIAAIVAVLELPGLPPKGDVSDWLDAAGSIDGLRDLVARKLAQPDAILSSHLRDGVWEETNLPFRTARELAQEGDDETYWLLPGYIAAGTVTEIHGKIKAAGKTTFITHAVACITEGRPFLGRPTRQTAVLYLTEQGRTSFKVALRRAGMLERDDVTVLLWQDVHGLDWADLVAQVVAEAQRRRCGLIVVDTLPRFAGLKGDAENNAGAADEAMAPLMLAAATGPAVVVIRHERKAGGEVGDAGRGSSAFGGSADIIVSVRRKEGGARPGIRVLQALSRFDETPDELTIELGPDGYAVVDGSGLAVDESAARLLSELPNHEEHALTDAEIKQRLGGSATTIERARDRLVSEGRVRRTGEGKRGSPFRYWLAPPPPPAQIVSSQAPSLGGRNESEAVWADLDVESDYPRSAWDPDWGSVLDQSIPTSSPMS